MPCPFQQMLLLRFLSSASSRGGPTLAWAGCRCSQESSSIVQTATSWNRASFKHHSTCQQTSCSCSDAEAFPALNAEDLKRMFGEFAAFGTRAAAADMDGSKFFKLCKDSRLLSKSFTAIDCDIIFAKVGTG